MDTEAIEKIRLNYIPVVNMWIGASCVIMSSKLNMTRIAQLTALQTYLESHGKSYWSKRELKKPFFQQLWNAYGRGF